MSNKHQSHIAKRIALLAESSEMEDIIKAFSGEYDIEEALRSLDLKLKFKDTNGEVIDADDTEVWLDDDAIRYTVSYQAEGCLVRDQPRTLNSPGNSQYFEKVYNIFDIDDLNKQLLQAGLLAKWKVDGEPVHIQKTYREKLVNGRFQKVDTSYEDTFCEFATEKFADKSLYHRALRDVWDDDGTIYAVVVLFNVDMEFEFELADFEAFGAFLMPFKIKAKEVKEKESMAKRRSLTEVGPRKPRVTSDDLATSMPHSKIKVPSTSDTRLGVWRDAEDVASRVGYDKVWHTTVTGEGKWRDFDYGGMVTWYTQFPMFFYAFDKEDALDRLSAFKSRKFAGQECHWTLSDPSEVDANVAQKAVDTYNSYASDVDKLMKSRPYEDISVELRQLSDKFREAAKPYEYKHSGENVPYTEKFCTHILAIPTTKMLDEMSKSADWAVALVQKLHDKDEARLKEAWLKTPDGKKWQRKFDQEKLAAEKRASREAEKARVAKEAAEHAEEIENCLDGQSKKFSQYNGIGVVPVEVIGGKKFKGSGYVYAIDTVESDFGYGGCETDMAKVFIPGSTSEHFASVNIKYCRIDTTVTPEKCKKVFDMWCQEKVNNTLEWCRSKQPSKPESDIQLWAANIVKKHAPKIDIQTYFPTLGASGIEDEKVKSTVKWAIGLGYDQSKTNFIIGRALAKKGINPTDYKDMITSQLEMEYGISTFQF